MAFAPDFKQGYRQGNQYIKDYEMIEYDLILGNQYLKDLSKEFQGFNVVQVKIKTIIIYSK